MRLIILRLSPGFWLFWKFWGETTRHFSTLRKRIRGSDRGSYATEKHGRSQFRESIMGGAGSPGSPFLFQGQAPRGSFWSKTWQKKIWSWKLINLWMCPSSEWSWVATLTHTELSSGGFLPFHHQVSLIWGCLASCDRKNINDIPMFSGERPDFLVNNNFSWLKPIYHMAHTFTPLFNGSSKTHTYCLKTIDQTVNSPSNAHQRGDFRRII